jgi:hypothetical protein
MSDVTARPWWRWESMVGAVVTDYGAGVRICGVTKDYLHGAAVEAPTNNHGPVWMRLRKERCTAVDTEDAATLGCLTQRARELWGAPKACTGTFPHHAGLDWYVSGLPCGVVPTRAATEWAALVAACDAAPHR